MSSKKLFLTMKDLRISKIQRARKMPAGQMEANMYLEALQISPDHDPAKIPKWFEETVERVMEQRVSKLFGCIGLIY